jgi:aspartyl protease family protein
LNLFWIILGAIGAACILLILNHDSGTVFGIESNKFASLVWYGTWGTLVAVAILPHRNQWRTAARNFAMWIGIFLVLMTGYLYRFELQDIGHRISGGLLPGSPISTMTEDGRLQTLLIRSDTGHFEADGRANGAPVRFLVDTGASVIVLTSEDAEAAGILTGDLSYSIPVTTANGRTTAARITLDEISIGDITRHKVQAMVAKPGALDQSLLGMSFLSSLSSFEFRGDRLVLSD